MTRNEATLTSMVSSTIVEYYNEHASVPVKKFQDKETAVRRTAALLEEKGMEFDEFCQLKPKTDVPAQRNVVPMTPEEKAEYDAVMLSASKINFNDDLQHELDSAHIGPSGEQLSEAEQTVAIADIMKKAGRAYAKKQRQLFATEGHNPFRAGSASETAYAAVIAEPGITFAECKARGLRMRAISHALKMGWIKEAE